MNNISKKFIKLIYELSNTQCPSKIIEKVRSCFIDYIAVTLGGSVINHKKNQQWLRENKLEGNVHIIGFHETTDLHSAVLINAFNAHTLELDDGHRFAMMHLAAPIFSGLLSVAEERENTLHQVLQSAVIGYEAAIRLSSSIQPNHKKRGFHATGTCGEIGCALAVAAMLGYSQEEMLHTLSASATSAAGLLEVITDGSEQKPYNIANAAVSGVDAALYGIYFTGPNDILGGDRGFFKNLSDGCNEDQLLSPTDTYAIEGIYMKPYASCRHCHAPVEATLKLSRSSGISPDEIYEIRVSTYDLAVFGHDHTEIDGVNSAKMSIPYCVAVAYLKHQCGMEMFTQDMITDNEILSLARKVKVVEDQKLSSLVPSKRAAAVTIVSETGEEKSLQVDYPKGEPENPISETEQREKFYSLAKSAGIDINQSRAFIDLVNSPEEKTITQLYQLLQI